MQNKTVMKAKFTFLLLFFILAACHREEQQQYNWSAYQGGKEVNQYAPLQQIDKANVHQLQVAWTYQTGDADTQKNRTQIQCNPIIVDGVLYGSSAKLKFFALNAATGEPLWIFDPFEEEGYDAFGMGVNRGVAYWTDGTEKRLFITASSFLYALDATTGKLILSFGKAGKVDLREGLDRAVDGLFIVSNTPGIVYKDKLILGSRVSEAEGAVPGHIRAYNVKTGDRTWIFHTIPHPGEEGYETWSPSAWQLSGGANVWAGFSLDEKRGIVYAPTGSASFDFYGGDRLGSNLFSNTLLALNADTGERLWHFQTVHHDLWDRDLPAPPNLVTVQHNGKNIDAVAQITKSAFIFLFDRATGKPLFPIEERPVPPSDLQGEEAASTQPIPLKPSPFARTYIGEEDLTRRTPEAYAFVKAQWEKLRNGPYFVPPSEQGSILLPGFDGGGEWGGAAFDPESGNLIVNASEMPWVIQMLPHENIAGNQGRILYNNYCLSCHGKNLEGSAAFGGVPSLVGLKERLTRPEVIKIVQKGRGTMPAFGYLTEEKVHDIASFLLEEEEETKEPLGDKKNWTYPYFFGGYNKFLDHEGYPAITPPWGTLNAVNLNTGELSWKVTLGEYPELVAQGLPPTGSESYGGPVVTSGGLVFMAGTLDEKFRAFDKDDGTLLWETKLPAAGFATPATYMVDGRQYVVIACGGGKLKQKSGDTYVAFALPE